MQARKKYYVVGSPILTQEFDRFLQEYDVALYSDYAVTCRDIRESLSESLTLHENEDDHVKNYRSPHYGFGWEEFERSQYKFPIFTVYVSDSGKLTSLADGNYQTTRMNIIIESVTVCGDSYIGAFYPKTYDAIVPKQAPVTSDDAKLLDDIKRLFNDYAHPKFGLFLTLHWNRHHTKLAETVRDGLPGTITEAHEYLMSKRQLLLLFQNPNLNGSFLRRMDFAIGRLLERMNPEQAPGLNR